MNNTLLDALKKYDYQEGEIFTVAGKQYMFITMMVLECLDTGEKYFKGIDF